MTNRDYDQFVKKASPNSKSYLNIPKAFVAGGAICTLGQLLLNLYLYLGAPEDLAPTAVSVSLCFSPPCSPG
jgi:stage V sporulation protein AC